MSKSNQIPVPSSRPRPALALVHGDGQPLDRRPSADPDAVHVRALSGILRCPEAEVRDILARLDLSWSRAAIPARAWRPPLRIAPELAAAEIAVAMGGDSSPHPRLSPVPEPEPEAEL